MIENEAEKKSSNRIKIYLISLIAAVGGFVLGYDMVIMSGAILFLKTHFTLTSVQEGFAMTSANYGLLAGIVIAGTISDWIGRKRTLLIAAILFGISAIGSALPRTFFEWNVYRIIGGIGGGLAAIVSPMYIAEISPAKIRGRLVSLNQLALCLSALTASIAAYYLAFIESWRWMYASEMAPIIVLLFGLPFIPRSPRWLVQKGLIGEAEKVLIDIDGPEHAAAEIKDIQTSMTLEVGKYTELFKPGVKTALFIAAGLAAFQQLAGVSTLIYYAPTLFQKAGIGIATEAIGRSIIINTYVIFCTIFAIWMVDKLGRRPLLLIGTVGMVIGQFLMGIVFYFDLSPFFALLVMFVCVGAYLISVAPLGWLIMSEIFPNRLRAKGMTIATICLQLCAIGANQAFPSLLTYFKDLIGSSAPVFWIFSALCLLAFIFSVKYVPETKGRTLEEISMSWEK